MLLGGGGVLEENKEIKIKHDAWRDQKKKRRNHADTTVFATTEKVDWQVYKYHKEKAELDWLRLRIQILINKIK